MHGGWKPHLQEQQQIHNLLHCPLIHIVDPPFLLPWIPKENHKKNKKFSGLVLLFILSWEVSENKTWKFRFLHIPSRGFHVSPPNSLPAIIYITRVICSSKSCVHEIKNAFYISLTFFLQVSVCVLITWYCKQ